MQLSLLDEVAEKKRIGFLATTWDGQRLALLLTKDPPDGSVSDNPHQACFEAVQLKIKSTSQEWIEALRKHQMD
jgi:hypothetical protein